MNMCYEALTAKEEDKDHSRCVCGEKRSKDYFLAYVPSGDVGAEAKTYYEEYFDFYNANCNGGDVIFTPISILDNIYKIWTKIVNDVYTYPEPKKRDEPSQFKLYKQDLICRVAKLILKDVPDVPHPSNRANFWFLPFSDDISNTGLNKWRGGLDYENGKIREPQRLLLYNRSRLGDFPDLFLESIKTYLSNGKYCAEGYDASIEGLKLSEFDWWFEHIGGGVKCSWETFTDKMHLNNSFVINGEVRLLFDHHIGSPALELNSIYDDEDFSINALAQKIATDPVVRVCVESIVSIWNTRADELSKVIPQSPSCP